MSTAMAGRRRLLFPLVLVATVIAATAKANEITRRLQNIECAGNIRINIGGG